MGSRIIVQRSEIDELRQLDGWILLSGRRKVGKTFLLKNFIPHDVYFAVRIDGAVTIEGAPIPRLDRLRELPEIVRSLLMQEKRVIIDEFQRLPLPILEEITDVHPHGQLILSGSSLRIIQHIFSRNSPLLGFFIPFTLPLISPRDILLGLREHFEPERALELAPFLRDPWVIPQYFGDDDLRFLYRLLCTGRVTVPALVGEVFTEEERDLTRTYASIVSLIGQYYTDHREIAGLLYNRGIIRREDTSLILPFIRNLEEMDLVERVKVFGTKRFRYRLASAVMYLYYYISSRTNLLDREVAFDEVVEVLRGVRNHELEDFLGDLFAQLVGGQKEYLKDPERELDIVVTKRLKIALVCEVKWGRLKKADIRNFATKTEDIAAQKMIVTKEPFTDPEIRCCTPSDIIGFANGTMTLL